MVDVVPFTGLMFADGEKGKRFSPPYDVISAEERENYAKNPYNIVHVILGNKNDDYKSAGALLRKWAKEGIMKYDSGKCFYIYDQSFKMPDGTYKTRTGLVAGLKLVEFEKGIVLPHEKTIPKHKADRLLLIKAAKAHTEQIFLIYDDKKSVVDTVLNKSRVKENKIFEFTDFMGVKHELYRLSEKTDQKKIQGTMGKMKAYIADGHHRYETALNYRNELRAKSEKTDKQDYILATLVNMNNPGLVVFPTHRCVFGIDKEKISSLRKKLEKDFAVKDAASQGELVKMVESGPTHTLGFWDKLNNKYYAATLKSESTMDEFFDSKSPTKKLDVSIIHKIILEKHLGITPEMQDAKTNLEYVKGTKETFEEMKNEKYQLACVIKATSVKEVKDVAGAGEKMPQKSTFFYPKVWSGLVIFDLQ